VWIVVAVCGGAQRRQLDEGVVEDILSELNRKAAGLSIVLAADSLSRPTIVVQGVACIEHLGPEWGSSGLQRKLPLPISGFFRLKTTWALISKRIT